MDKSWLITLYLMILSHFGLSSHSLGHRHRTSPLSCYVLLQRQTSLGLNQLQSLTWLLVHHLEEGVLQDWVQFVTSHLELV